MSSIKDKILEINKNNNLTKEEKNKLINNLMNPKKDNLLEDKKELIECNHYIKKCNNFLFECCNKYYPCHRCHNSYSDELTDSPCHKSCIKSDLKIIQITCESCGQNQIPSNQCVNPACQIQFAPSYCNICYIWTQTPHIYHCSSCKICRVGKAEELVHCDPCGMCFKSEFFQTHKCTKTKVSDRICALCLESLFDSQTSVSTLNCGHIIHGTCMENLLQSNEYRCPNCRKSMIDMESHWNFLRYQIKLQPIPKQLFPIEIGEVVISPYGNFLLQEKIINVNTNTNTNTDTSTSTNIFYKGIFVNWSNSSFYAIINQNDLHKNLETKIYCNDCGTKTNNQFHFLGIECTNCSSFNTTIL